MVELTKVLIRRIYHCRIFTLFQNVTYMTDCIPYRDTHYFSDLICNYLDEKPELEPFYNHFPTLKNFEKQLQEKKVSYANEYRETLVEVLQNQYKSVNISNATKENIVALSSKKTFTITTGHQLNLFTGPLYFLYKIVSTINLTKKLKAAYPEYNFVPVYWMATEDHDFEEINFFNFQQKKIPWNRNASGAVGELSTDGLDEVFEVFSKEMNHSENAEFLRKLFQKAYLNHDNLADATFYLANELFGEYGLVCIDANKRSLKKLFIPSIKSELLYQTSFEKTTHKIERLQSIGHKPQVNPREINLFYLGNGIRERIIKKDDSYYVNETELVFTEKEILQLLENEPEKFSPNVIMRPLFQESILPNLCYIGGGGELAYWFELKDYFEAEKITFPILLLRNSALLVSEKETQKIEKLDETVENLFLDQPDLLTKHTRKISDIKIDFLPQKEHLKKQFEDLYHLANKTDKSFIGAVAAQEKKQLNGLNHLEKRLMKAQKRKMKDELERLSDLQNTLFPNQSLQERSENFSTFYLEYGKDLLPRLFKELNPLSQAFKIIYL